MMSPTYAHRVTRLQPSPIREILAVVDRPDMISFAGGLPSPETFPPLPDRLPADALQYGPSEGEPRLRRQVARLLADIGIEAPPERVLIVTGSQQGIDLVGKLFIDDGTPVAVEFPTYLAALQVFSFYGANYTRLDWAAPEALGLVPLVYVVPTFANPTGRCATSLERTSLAKVCAERDITLFEDDPYRDLVYGPCDRAPVVASMPPGSSWVYQGSFSKTLCPGLRVGFLVASDDELFTRLVRAKQASDLHTSRLSQALVADLVDDPGWEQRLADLCAFYRDRRDTFDDALDRHLGGLATWERPEGGLFYWLRLSAPVDTRALLGPAIERGVAFMPGEPFHPGPAGTGTLRLNFSHATPENADRGLAVLGALVAGTRNNPALTGC